ncbi:MAG: amidohydrolase family protein [Cyclobacteriaceae bacterium]|nr:amidohydrolase family protein [Cyclobacteriaceae bacterium]
MYIDSHQHFWKYSPADLSWIDDSMDVLKRDYLPEDLIDTLKSEGFDGCISVQAQQKEKETQFLLELSEHHSFIKGVVGWVDLQSDKVGEVLCDLKKYSKFKGVRHLVQDEPDIDFILRKNFQRGIARLADYSLTYDILIFPQHLENAYQLVKAFPQQKFVIDHLAKPLIKNKIMEPWATHLQRIAELPNVMCKLSGMVTEAKWGDWQEEDFYPYLDVVVRSFGVDRIMVGTDWPVSLLSGSLSSTINIVKNYFRSSDKTDIDKIFGGNARNFYSI